MNAVIMAGGKGLRLRPLTCDIPKPMVPVMNAPIMRHIIDLLKTNNISNIGVTLMYLPQKIKDYFENGSSLGVNMEYFIEPAPLGTAGSVKNAQNFLDKTFVVISGDSLTNMNLMNAFNFHKAKKAMATLILSRVTVPLEYGVVTTDQDGKITGFLEKPSWGEVFSDTVNTGTYILESEVLDYFKQGQEFDFSKDLFPMLLKDNQPIYGYVTEDYWCDIGDLQAYLQAHYDVLSGKINLKTLGRKIRDDVWIGNGTIIDPSAEVIGPCVIGENCRINKGSIIDSLCVIGNNNVIENNVSIKRSVLWNSNYVESNAEINGTIVCNKIDLKKFVALSEGVVIGSDCIISERAIIKPHVRIWPQKSVDPLATVDRSIIWGARHSRTIFGENGLSGVINVDITPEFATRLGAAYGSILKNEAKVVVSCTQDNSARMVEHAIIGGILSSAKVKVVFNVGNMLTPIARHAVNFLSVDGGIHIKLSNGNPNKLRLDFMDSRGASISRVLERKIENAFFSEDFKRGLGEEIGRLDPITDFRDYYIKAMLDKIDVSKIRARSLKVCIASPSEFVISVVSTMLLDVGCKVSNFSASSLDEVQEFVQKINNENTDFTAFIDNNGEKLVLVDNGGRIIKDDLFLTLTSLIIFKNKPNAKVVVPITAPSVIDYLGKKYRGNVLRTKASVQAIMEQMLNHGLFENRENMDQFMLNFDALSGLVKIVEFLCSSDTILEELIDEIPDFYVSKKTVFCPWELKGKVMRMLIDQENERKLELVDGVKFVLEEGWALVLPDADMPFCRVYSEGKTHNDADMISETYREKIKRIIGS